MVNSTSKLDDPLKWYMYCICQGQFGTLAFIVSTALFLFVGTPIHCWSLWLLLHGNIKPSFVLPLNLVVVDLVFCIQSFADLITAYYNSVAIFKMSMFLFGLCWTVRTSSPDLHVHGTLPGSDSSCKIPEIQGHPVQDCIGNSSLANWNGQQLEAQFHCNKLFS